METTNIKAFFADSVPKSIASNFGLKNGDHLYWKINPSTNGRRLIILVEPERGNSLEESRAKR